VTKILVAKTQTEGQRWIAEHPNAGVKHIVTRPDHLRGMRPTEVFYTLDAAFNRYFIQIEDEIEARRA
jgi:hypothetical protein